MSWPPVYHQPVLVAEVLAGLQVRAGGGYIDCTVGEGGHAQAILESSIPDGRLLGLDADPQALVAARRRLESFGGAFLAVNANFAQLDEVADAHGFGPAHGILFDLGLSSLQLEGEGRGFSFQRDDPLDMRLSPQQGITAADIVNTSSEEELATLFFQFGEERQGRRIARAIVQARPLDTARQLAQVVERVVPRQGRRLHPATRVFQALRIVVNDELGNLDLALAVAVDLLVYGGRLVVVSYHSLEDRLVKQFMQREARDCLCPPGMPVCQCGHQARLRVITRKIITPSPQEVAHNPRSRSARLRVAEHRERA